MTDPSTLLFIAIGTAAGLLAGVFGLGGGIIIVPALIYLAGFPEHRATGTSLAVLLPPIGLAATMEYYRAGNVDVRAAVLIAITVFAGAWAGSSVAHRLSGPHLRLGFALFVLVLGVSLVISASRRLGWL
ncbi:MAG: sulfite exporter TauE/SafE family protein [Vicinamibacterales bacterium]